MRLLHITEACGGGVYRHLSLLMPVLARCGIECAVLLFGNRLEESSGGIAGARVFRQPVSGTCLNAFLKGMEIIRRQVESYAPDLVCLHSFIAGVSGRLAVSGTPWASRCVYTPHAFSFHRPRPLHERLFVWTMERYLVSRTAAYVCVGANDMKDAIALGAEPGRVYYCPNGLPEEMDFLPREEARRKLGLKDGITAGVCPARWEPQKGLETLLKALEKLSKENICVYCYGRGSLGNQLRGKIASGHLERKCVLCEELPELWRYLKGFDFLVLPSWYEGNSYTLLEAVAAGLPVVTTDIPEAPEGAVLFQPGDWRTLGKILQEQRWQVPVKKYPSIEQQAEELITLYKKISFDVTLGTVKK